MVGSLRVVGIGTVELPVKRSPRATGLGAHGILRLHNVLHIPALICNVIGRPIDKEYLVCLAPVSPNHRGTISDKQGTKFAYFDPCAKLCQVRLSGPPIGPRVGPKPFDPSKAFFINVVWPDSEREKWKAWQERQASQASRTGSLSDKEKKWLKEHYKGEYYFLRSHGLSIYKIEDREEGRRILRIMMTDESDDEESVPSTWPRGYYPPDHPSRQGDNSFITL
jgi:hypothetical protein